MKRFILLAVALTACKWTDFDDLSDQTWVRAQDKPSIGSTDYAISADACFALTAVTAITAIYYTFRDKGPPTRAQIDARAIAVTPELGRNYAGLGMEVHW